MDRSIKLALAVGAIVALGGTIAVLTLHKAKHDTDASTKVMRGDLQVVVSETGTIQPLTKVEIKSLVAGQVQKLMVDVGARVKKGQVLIQLDPRDIERRRAEAQADREIAMAKLAQLKAGSRIEDVEAAVAQVQQNQASADRTKADYLRSLAAVKTGTITTRDAELAKSDYLGAEAQLAASRANLAKLKNGALPEEIETARAELDKAEIALKESEDQLAYASIRAPMDGTVIKRGIEVGEMVSPGVSATAQGTSMLTIANLDSLVIATNLNQIDVGKVRKGQHVDVRVDSAPGKVFSGEVRKVAPAADKSTDNGATVQTFPIETILASADAETLKPGMSADLDIQVTTRHNALYLPVEAVIRGKDNQGTVTLPGKGNKDKPLTRAITIGLTNDHQIEVLNGLQEGQEVLIKPPSSADNAVKF